MSQSQNNNKPAEEDVAQDNDSNGLPSEGTPSAGDPATAPPAAAPAPKIKGASRKSVTFKKKQEIVGPHPLQTPWTFWYCKKNKQSNFETTLVSLGTCNTVEEFFTLYSRLRRPHELQSNSNLHLFRGNTRPMWENYPSGGQWALRLRKGCLLLSRMWEELLIACIGENFDEPDVLGVVISIRPKEDALFLWNANHHLKYTICEKLKSILHLPANCPMEYTTNRHNMERRLAPGKRFSDLETTSDDMNQPS
eukprot:TRINITY_DN1151_c0_g1_i1.p1 TRINITY_DN1151_c0_g1~~TRINITY_DN1151_c0_g1_i1.p1  ORF type:complete len:251 (-),score=40.63 TRINITY_DN1151_c0_g1_i1:153-905(-)